MLNELELLSQNIGRLIAISDHLRQDRQELERKLEDMRRERDEARTAVEQFRTERDSLREERDALIAKIEDAQVRLNVILEKLPHHRAASGQPVASAQNEGDRA